MSAGAVPPGPAQQRIDTRHPRRHLVFVIVSIGLFMTAVDQTIVTTALVNITAELHASLNLTGWTITIFALFQILASPIAGTLSDSVGPRSTFVGGVVIFGVASLSCGLAPNAYVLVGFRAVQAIGGGAILPAGSGLVSDLYGPARDRALGMFSSIFATGAVAGPVLGGLVVARASWRWLFFVNVPIAIALAVGGWVVLTSRSGPVHRRRVDGWGIALLGVALACLTLAVTTISGSLTGWIASILLLTLGGLSAFLFVRHSARATDPFVPIRLLSGPGFGPMNFINVMFGCSAFGLLSIVPVYATYRYGLAPLDAGSALAARAIGMIAVSGLAVLAQRRTGVRLPMVVGSVVVAISMIAMVVGRPPSVDAVWWLCLTATGSGIGMGLALPASNNAGLRLAGADVAAVAGLRSMFRQAGGVLTVAVATTVVSAASGTSAGTAALTAIFVVFSVLLLASVPVILRVPDHRGPLTFEEPPPGLEARAHIAAPE
jgi:EmrB/QacA subfamily drug resistance transporter